MIQATFDIESCEVVAPMAEKVVKIQISGGVFMGAFTGHDSDATNSSLEIEGLTEAILTLPIVNGTVWDARVFYAPDDGWTDVIVKPSVTHHEDVKGKSFHTLGREGTIGVEVQGVVEKLETPKNLTISLVNTRELFLTWDPVEKAQKYELFITGSTGDAAKPVVHETSYQSGLLPWGTYWAVMMRAIADYYEPSEWSTSVEITIPDRPKSDLEVFIEGQISFLEAELERLASA